MNRTLTMVIGLLLVLAGAVWTLQGLDILGGSAMSGTAIWAGIGPVVAVLGAVVAWRAYRRPR